MKNFMEKKFNGDKNNSILINNKILPIKYRRRGNLIKDHGHKSYNRDFGKKNVGIPKKMISQSIVMEDYKEGR